MNHRLRSAVLALAVLVPLLSVGASARAAVDPDDEAAKVIRVTQQDESDDLKVVRGEAKKVPARVLRSIDLARVGYRIDRVAQDLTITLTLRHALAQERAYRAYFITVISAHPMGDDGGPFAFVTARPQGRKVRVLTGDGGTIAAHGFCRAATATVLRDRIYTQTVPFSCLRGAIEHGKLVSAVGLEKRTGGDVAYDLVKPTRDLPLTAYVAPPAG